MDLFFLYVLIGIGAQMIDGTLGMAYGVSSTTFLRSTGLPQSIASASVHCAEVFTTLVSGISHFSMKNIDKKLLLKLAVPGIIGGVCGAYILSSETLGEKLTPYISVYLILMGVVILIKTFVHSKPFRIGTAGAAGLGITGGFFDAVGGGGWGPIVTTTLMASGFTPRFVTVSQSIVFISTLKFSEYWMPIAGLALGGVIAAPFGALLCKKIPVKPFMILVACLIILLNVRTLCRHFGAPFLF